MTPRHPPIRRVNCQRGFGLVEVMVTLIIIAVGMLGIAKLQALAMSSTGVAGLRSLAAIEASSLAAGMHADRDYWSGAPVPFTANKGVITDATGTMTAAVDCTSTGALPCTNAQMAAFDVQNWVNDVNNVLPNSQVTVGCAATIPVNCTIQISWTENAVAINTNESTATAANIAAANTAQIQVPAYILYVEP